MANELIPFKEPGADVTGQAASDVTGKRCLAITGDLKADGSLTVAHATAAGRICGVAKYDATTGKKVGIVRGPGRVVPIKAAGNISAFAEVEVGTAGQVVTLAEGVAIGYVETAVTSGSDARVYLY